MFIPDIVTYIEVVIAMVGLFIAGFFAKKKQAAKKYAAQQKDKLEGKGN